MCHFLGERPCVLLGIKVLYLYLLFAFIKEGKHSKSRYTYIFTCFQRPSQCLFIFEKFLQKSVPKTYHNFESKFCQSVILSFKNALPTNYQKLRQIIMFLGIIILYMMMYH